LSEWISNFENKRSESLRTFNRVQPMMFAVIGVGELIDIRVAATDDSRGQPIHFYRSTFRKSVRVKRYPRPLVFKCFCSSNARQRWSSDTSCSFDSISISKTRRYRYRQRLLSFGQCRCLGCCIAALSTPVTIFRIGRTWLKHICSTTKRCNE